MHRLICHRWNDGLNTAAFEWMIQLKTGKTLFALSFQKQFIAEVKKKRQLLIYCTTFSPFAQQKSHNLIKSLLFSRIAAFLQFVKQSN